MTRREEVRVPDIGDFHDVEIVDVLVRSGDTVAAEAPLITLETEKASMEVPSPFAGRIAELKVARGGRVSKGSLIALLDVEGEAVAAAPKPPAAEVKPAPSAPRPASVAAPAAAQPAAPAAAPALPEIDESTFSKAHASPSVRKFARELGVDLARVKGSGLKGRILPDDVKAFVKSILSGAAAGAGLPKPPEVDFAKYGEIEVEPLSRIRRISGPRLQAAWLNIPHVTQHDEADITVLEERRLELKPRAEAQGFKLTPLAFVIRACVLALGAFPDFNTSLTADAAALVRKKYHHIGFAADTPQGLVVPVIREATAKSLFDLARELGTLSARAREGKLGAEEMRGGTFTVSSLGGIGGTFFTPIINAPEVAILGVGRATRRPVWQDGKFVPRLMLPLSLSYDHRVIDGAAGARFITFLVQTLSAPDRLQ